MNFNNLSNKTKCKFFNTPTGCKNKEKCPFSHEIDNWRESVELTPEEKIKKEVADAIMKGTLNDIFYKMVTNSDDYNKYYNHLNLQFREVVTWKLKRKSIKVYLLDTLQQKDVNIDENEEYIKYGYIPLCYHFILKNIAWKLFVGCTEDNLTNKDIESCFDEIVDIIFKIYSKEGYKNIIKHVTEYANPSNFETVLHIATYYLCDIIMSHIKKEMNPNDFNLLLKETNKWDYDVIGLYNYRKNQKNTMIEKYQKEYEKSVKYLERTSNSKEKISSYKKLLDENIASIDIRLNCFYNEIFDEVERVPIKYISVNHTDEFTKKLDIITKNSIGYACNINSVNELINWINMFFSNAKKEKLHLILGKITDVIINADKLMELIVERKLEPEVWSYIICSIDNKYPLSKCPALLYEFFKIEKIGLREAYIGEYLNKLCDVVDSFSISKKKELIEILNMSLLDKTIPKQLNELIMM